MRSRADDPEWQAVVRRIEQREVGTLLRMLGELLVVAEGHNFDSDESKHYRNTIMDLLCEHPDLPEEYYS